ncbi:MAG: group 1 truncated hemoglobin [Sneathiella sp.]
MVQRTLFEKYGGFSSISKVILTLYDQLLDSEYVGDLFDDVDMDMLVDHQTKFIASLLGGPSSYSDAQIRQIHSKLPIDDKQFDEMKEVLSQSLEQHGFEAVDSDMVIRSLESRRDLIVE